jgi:4-hydroxy-tetrahydrodipicolinate reductase
MGRAVLSCALEAKEFEIAAALEAPDHPLIGKTVAEGCGIAGCSVRIESSPKAFAGKKAVIVDFSTPVASQHYLSRASEQRLPMVIGTTGFEKLQIDRMKKASEEIPIVFASNMSVGVNLLFKLVEEAAGILGPDYDTEIIEIHHRFKKDAPSGTAKTLAGKIAQARSLDPAEALVHGRKGMIGDRKSGEIGIHALRAGDIVGEHTVVFATLGERIEMTHRCHSRNTFALGALRAARFVFDRAPGFFDMQDVLGFR